MDGCSNKQKGFTLLELMLALAIIALLLNLSAPSFRAMLARVEISEASSAFHLALHQTRSEAISSGRRVTMCALPAPTTNQSRSDGNNAKQNPQASTACATRKNSHWNNGWMLFLDDNADGNRANNESILSTHPREPGSLSADGNRFVKAYVSYTPLGESRLAKGSRTGGFFQTGTISFCSRHNKSGYKIVINRAGRASKRPLVCSK